MTARRDLPGVEGDQFTNGPMLAAHRSFPHAVILDSASTDNVRSALLAAVLISCPGNPLFALDEKADDTEDAF